MRINSKPDFFRLWRAGALGNTPRTWATVDEALLDGARMVAFRQVGVAGGGRHDIVPASLARETATEWQMAGRRYSLDEAAPDHLSTLQGEVCRTFRGLEGVLGVKTGLRMREAARAGLLRPASPALATALLDRFMDPSSRDDLDALLDLYPDATVEFACYSCDVGVIPNRNVIFWEVRNY